MNPETLTRSAAIVLLAGTVLACAVELGRLGNTSEPSAVTATNADDPLTRELTRCKALRERAADDAGCKSAWKESRERFLKGEKPERHRANDLFPSTNPPLSPNTKQKLFLDRVPSAPPLGSGERPAANPERR
jgi:conjugative transfer region protein TrbK